MSARNQSAMHAFRASLEHVQLPLEQLQPSRSLIAHVPLSGQPTTLQSRVSVEPQPGAPHSVPKQQLGDEQPGGQARPA
jgi:hypothetical protein